MNLPKHIQEAATPITDAAIAVQEAAPAKYSLLAKDARNLERLTIWQQEVMSEIDEALSVVEGQYPVTAKRAKAQIAELQSYLKTLKGEK